MEDDGGTFETFKVRLAAQIYGWARHLVDPPTAPTVHAMTPHPEFDIDLLLTVLSKEHHTLDTACPHCGTFQFQIQVVGVSTPETVLGLETHLECSNGHEAHTTFDE